MKKIVLTVSGFWFLVFGCSGQEILWQKTFGGNDDDYLYSIQPTSDGGYILGGVSTSNISGNKTENCMGGGDFWVLKTDASGNIQWQNTIGGNVDDFLYSAQETSDGGYILGGYSRSSVTGDKTIGNMGTIFTYDYWIIKLDMTGNIQWQNVMGGNDNDYLYSIQQTNDGGYILGGWSLSNISGNKTENSNGQIDYWIVKTDPSGNIQWQNTIGGLQSDILNSVRQTSDGGYILGGWSYSGISGDKTENTMGTLDYWVIKTDTSGNIEWQNTIGSGSGDYLHWAEQSTDGGYILGGYSYYGLTGDKTEAGNGGYDYWLVKIDSSGNIEWQNVIGGANRDEIHCIRQCTDGGYILGGFSDSNISGDKTENNMGIPTTHDFWIVKTDSTGTVLWENTVGGTGEEQLSFVQESSKGNYILGGYSRSNISGDKSENCLGDTDYWIMKVTDNTNSITGKLFIDDNSNGVQDSAELSVSNNKVYELNTGRFVFPKQNGSYNLTVLDTGNFTSFSALSYYNAVPATHSSYFSDFHQTDSLNDFAFQPAGVFNDLCITITPMGNFRPGFGASYMLNYENVGTTALNPTVIFFPDSSITFFSSNPMASLITVDSVVWNFGPLAPFQAGTILVTVNVDAGTPIGTFINSLVHIEPVAGDANAACNYSEWGIYTTGAVDPNAILVDRDTVFTTELSSPPYLNYIIYFQNTGNDTAFNARVLNNIPQMLDVNSFEFVASSHPMNIVYGAHARLMTFTFDNILLPDSNVNEPASHGFIRYRIKPNSTLVAGDSIQNTAYIYFDFNAPVQTNIAVTEIVLPTGEEEFKVQSSKFKVFPNPVRDELIVNGYSLTGKTAEVIIYDLFGKKVYQKQLETLNFKLETKINVSLFSQGIYFVRMESGEKVLRGKFLKE